MMKTSSTIRHKLKHALRLDRALKLVWQAGPGRTLLSTFLIIIQGLLPVVFLYLIKLIVDTVTLSVSAPDKTGALETIAFLITAGACVALIQALCQLMINYVQEAQSLCVTDYVTHILHEKSINADLEYYENPNYHDTFHRAQQEGPYRPTRIVTGLMQIGQSGISLLAMTGLLLSFHWGAAGLLFFAGIPGLVVRLKSADRLFQWQQQATHKERKAGYFSWLLTGEAHAKEIRLFGIGHLFADRFNALRQSLRHERLGISRQRALWDFTAQAGTVIALFSAFGLIIYRTIHGMITIGDMVMYFQAFQRGITHLKEFLTGLAGIYEDNLFISNFYDFLDITNKIQSPARPVPVPRPIEKGIVFDHVSFRYPSGRHNVLNDVSFAIKPGETIALVGGNGSGKTTLVKLLCRFYDPPAGNILLDDVNIRQYDPTALRKEIGVLFQDFARYHLTAGENIRLGDPDALSDSEQGLNRIITASRKAGAEEMIAGLPDGYDTMLGKWLEPGEELSLGEWQKMALARSFMREGQLIILDEPAASLDAKSEYDVFSRFKELLKGKSAVLISHRFSTVQMADRIIVLENGNIIETGTHSELLALGGKYAEMYKMQAACYQSSE